MTYGRTLESTQQHARAMAASTSHPDPVNAVTSHPVRNQNGSKPRGGHRRDHCGPFRKQQQQSNPASTSKTQSQPPTSNYDYRLEYRPGSQVSHADGLSRLPLPHKPSVVPVPEEVVLVMRTLGELPITATQVAQWTARDPILSLVHKYVLQGWPASCRK